MVLNVLAATLYLKVSTGIVVKDVQDWKAKSKFVAAILYLKTSTGIVLNAALLYSR